MRGVDVFSEQLFTVKRLEEFIPANHPLRPVREMVNEALRRLDGLFAGMYEPSHKGGRPSIAPEKLARAMLLQVFYSIRSERQLMEQVQYNLLFRWFIGLSMDDAVWVPTGFYPANTDTSDKPHHGAGGVSCDREESSAKSSSVRQLA